MNLTKNAIKVLEKRYLTKDENGKPIEDSEGMFRRVAHAIALADKDFVSEEELAKIEKEFFELMTNLEFLPNSPTLMNAGRPLGQLSACFVLPIEDTMEGIFESIKNAALIHKSGGGTGFSFSRLRQKGATVNTTGGVASGPISFMKVFNAATEAVKQGGTRRGANMGIIRVDHPDIMEFITCKKDNADITNFNISVGITESFMNAAQKGEDYDLIDPHTKKPTGKLNAKEVFTTIVEMAWRNGEPGIIFLDRLNKDNVTPEIGEIESTNPCGEQPLLPYEACNLGSINLSLMVKFNGEKTEVNYERLGRVVRSAVHFLDNVIDVNKYPLSEIDEMTRGTRKIGLGVMGWADMLCKLGIPYNSHKAINLAEKVMGFIQENGKKASLEIAERKGAFPYYEKSIFAKKDYRIRNATVTTIAPTGTLSIIAGVSSGIEPLFAISYIRNVMDNDELVEVNPLFKEIAQVDGFYSDDLMKRIAQHGGLAGFSEIPTSISEVFVTAHDISPEWHVKMQAAFQKHTDNAVSKTVNLCNDATTADVEEVYLNAYKTGCKGVTIYRDGSRDLQVLNIGKVKGKDEGTNAAVAVESKAVNSKGGETRNEINTNGHVNTKFGNNNKNLLINNSKLSSDEFTHTANLSETEEKKESIYGTEGLCVDCEISEDELLAMQGIKKPLKYPKVEPRPRPEITTGFTEKVRIGCGNLYITVNYDEHGICEVFTNTGRAGGCPSQSEATSRLVSIALRSGIDVKSIVEQLKGIRCPSTIRQKDMKVMSCPDAIGRLIEKVAKMQNGGALEEWSGSKEAAVKPSTSCETSACSECGMQDLCNNPEKEVKDEERRGGCPECGKAMEHEGGCVICRNCGYSKCG